MASHASDEGSNPQQQPPNLQLPMGYPYDLMSSPSFHHQPVTSPQLSMNYPVYSYALMSPNVLQQQEAPNLHPMNFSFDMATPRSQYQQQDLSSPTATCESPDVTTSSIISHRVFVGSLQLEVCFLYIFFRITIFLTQLINFHFRLMNRL